MAHGPAHEQGLYGLHALPLHHYPDDAGQDFKRTVVRAPALSTLALTAAEPAFQTPTRWDATEPRLEDERGLGPDDAATAVYCMPPRGV